MNITIIKLSHSGDPRKTTACSHRDGTNRPVVRTASLAQGNGEEAHTLMQDEGGSADSHLSSHPVPTPEPSRCTGLGVRMPEP